MKHSFELRGFAGVRDGHISESSHQHSIDGDTKVRLQLQPADKLRDHAVKNKRIKKVYVVDGKKTGSLGIKPGRNCRLQSCTGEPHDIPIEESNEGIDSARA
jgi:hypothetical protein